ncbi:SSBP3 protein, partial [Neopipo cinnamomea]|nr:SSBP3 protein [Neopipo cinnamomea]
RLALYVYEYLLHVGAQKSAQTFLSEIRWEKNITLGEPPGFLHSWWCVFWDLYCAAPDRRETCEHSSEAKAFHDYVSAVGLGGPVMGNLPPGDGMSGGPVPPAFFQVLHGGLRGTAVLGVCTHVSQAWMGLGTGTQGWGQCQECPSPSDPPVSRQTYGSGMRPPPSSLAGPGMPAMNMGPGGRGPWPNPNANSIAYSSSSPGNYVVSIGGHFEGGGGASGEPLRPLP